MDSGRGGTAETEGRRITGSFTDDQALWVGAGSADQGACYSGIAAGNPVNANGRGVQLEYQTTVAESSNQWVDPEALAEYVLGEF